MPQPNPINHNQRTVLVPQNFSPLLVGGVLFVVVLLAGVVLAVNAPKQVVDTNATSSSAEAGVDAAVTHAGDSDALRTTLNAIETEIETTLNTLDPGSDLAEPQNPL